MGGHPTRVPAPLSSPVEPRWPPSWEARKAVTGRAVRDLASLDIHEPRMWLRPSFRLGPPGWPQSSRRLGRLTPSPRVG
jgi:hypothetical protein